MSLRTISLLLLAVATSLAGCVRTDIHKRFVTDSWSVYLEKYLQPEGYILDPRLGNITSEGQGYALLRAAWLGDAESFEVIHRWTRAHMRRPDGLHSWLVSPTEGVVDRNSAADADQEIAFALLLGADRFDRPDYMREAADLLAAIRTHSAVELDRGWFPAAGNWAVESRTVNLSYFLPYAYPYFDRADPQGNWLDALDAGYRILERYFDGQALLPPDFMALSVAGDPAPLREGSGLSGHFSYDAMRLPWRMALDCQLHRREKACRESLTATLVKLLERDGVLYTRYRPDGEVVSRDESLSFYGSLLPALRLNYPETANRVLHGKLTPISLEILLRSSRRYYDHNWVWFGLAADSGFISARTPPPAQLVQ